MTKNSAKQSKKNIKKKNTKTGKKSRKVRLNSNNVHNFLEAGNSAKGGGLGSACGSGANELQCWKLMVYYDLDMSKITKQEQKEVRNLTFNDLQNRDPDVNAITIIEDRLVPNPVDYGQTSIVEIEFDGGASGGIFNSQKLDSLVASVAKTPVVVKLDPPNNVLKSIAVKKDLGFKSKPMERVSVAIGIADVAEGYERRVSRAWEQVFDRVKGTPSRWKRNFDEKRMNLVTETPTIQNVQLLEDKTVTTTCTARDADNPEHISKCSELQAQECGACEDTSPFKDDPVCLKPGSFRQKGTGTGASAQATSWGTAYTVDPDCEWKKFQQDAVPYGPRGTDTSFPRKPATIKTPDKQITGTADEMEAYVPNPAAMDLCGADGCIEPIAPLNIKFPGDFSKLTPDIIEDLNKQLKARILELGGFSQWTDDQPEIIDSIQWVSGSIIAIVSFTRAASNYGIDHTDDLVDLINKTPISIKSGDLSLVSEDVSFVSADDGSGSGSGSGSGTRVTSRGGGVKFSIKGGDIKYNNGRYRLKTKKSNTKFKNYNVNYLF